MTGIGIHDFPAYSLEMLPWLFPTYLIFGFGGLVITAIFRKTKWSAIIWTFIVMCTVNLMIITVQSPPHLEGGPGGLTVFGLIPNCIVFGVCAVVLLFLLIFHPAWEFLGNPWLLLAVIPWALIAYILASVPWIWGYYPLEVHVIDWEGKPLAGVKIHFWEERTGISLEQAFLLDDVTGDTVTDSNGNAVYTENNYRRIFGAVNGYWQDPGDRNRQLEL